GTSLVRSLLGRRSTMNRVSMAPHCIGLKEEDNEPRRHPGLRQKRFALTPQSLRKLRSIGGRHEQCHTAQNPGDKPTRLWDGLCSSFPCCCPGSRASPAGTAGRENGYAGDEGTRAYGRHDGRDAQDARRNGAHAPGNGSRVTKAVDRLT